MLRFLTLFTYNESHTNSCWKKQPLEIYRSSDTVLWHVGKEQVYLTEL